MHTVAVVARTVHMRLRQSPLENPALFYGRLYSREAHGISRLLQRNFIRTRSAVGPIAFCYEIAERIAGNMTIL